MNQALSEEVNRVALTTANGLKKLCRTDDDTIMGLNMTAIILLCIATDMTSETISPRDMAGTLRTWANAMDGHDYWDNAIDDLRHSLATRRRKH